MKWMIEESDPNEVKADELAAILDASAERLRRAARIIRHEEDDAVGFISKKQ